MCQHALTASDVVMWAPEMKDKTPCKEQNTGFKEAGGLQRICLLCLDLLYSDTSVLYKTTALSFLSYMELETFLHS